MSALNQQDVTRLMKHPVPSVRATICSKLSAMIDAPTLTPAERDIANDIIRIMSRDVAAVVRSAVAHNLRRSPNLPHDVALQLAQDIEAVSLPILTESIVLSDDDLVSIVKAGSTVKQKAIAARKNVSEQVSDVIISVGAEAVVATLMKNASARIGDGSFGKAIERFTGSDAVKESMVMREKLPLAISEKLAAIVSDRLKDYLVAHHELPPAIAADIIQRSQERSMVELSHRRSQEDIENLVARMHLSGRLTPDLIARALCVGNVAFFEAAMAANARISLQSARVLIHDPGGTGLMSLCEKAKMPEPLVDLFRIALKILGEMEIGADIEDLERFRSRLIERVLTQTAHLSQVDQEYLLGLLR